MKSLLLKKHRADCLPGYSVVSQCSAVRAGFAGRLYFQYREGNRKNYSIKWTYLDDNNVPIELAQADTEVIGASSASTEGQ